MSSWANNAIVAKAKSIYGGFIKPEEYRRMTKLKSIPDLVGYLKKHKNYQEILAGVQENSIRRGNLEALVKKNAFQQIDRLIKFANAKDDEFYQLNYVRQENELILAIIRTLISSDSGKPQGIVPFFHDIKTKLKMSQLLKATNLLEVIEALSESPYAKLIEPFETRNNNNIRYLNIEHVLEQYYYDEAFRRIDKYYKGELNKDLKSIFQTRIELGNIIKIYRLKKFYSANQSAIKDVLILKYSRINETKIDQIIAIKNPDEILKYLSNSEFSRFSSDQDYIYVEYYAGRIRYDLAKKFMYYAKKVPTIYLAFITLSEIEIENITNIIEGIRYQVNEQEIERMLIC